jgi:hypothetical protein
MKKVLSMACAAALVCGCAIRPNEGPGSRYGADYVPNVHPISTDVAAFDKDVAHCRLSAVNVPFKMDRHDDALAAIDVGTVGLGWAAGWGVLPGGGALLGLAGLHFVAYMPERVDWWSRQETMLMNCMAEKGYVNADPTVNVTWAPRPPSTRKPPPRATGRDTYNVEALAKDRNCAAVPFASLQEKGPGFELHAVPCSDGEVMVVRCEFGNCASESDAMQNATSIE